MKISDFEIPFRFVRQSAITERDSQLAELRAQLADIEAVNARLRQTKPKRGKTARPSFFAQYSSLLRRHEHLASLGVELPVWRLNPKDAGYEFAEVHGLSVPQVYGRFESIEEINWSDLPAEFVLKTLDGTSARGVVPLQRTDDKFVDMLDVAAGHLTRESLVERHQLVRSAGKVSHGIQVEELLRSPYPKKPGVALDIKLYCFYGEVGMVMIRDSNGSRSQDSIRVRYFSPDGGDLGDAMANRKPDPEIPTPIHLSQLLVAGEKLSREISLPFVRLDFFEQPDRIVFGEVTPTPGGRQQPRADVDLELGRMWERAEARLMSEVASAGLLKPSDPIAVRS
jgi:hypothetical protein